MWSDEIADDALGDDDADDDGNAEPQDDEEVDQGPLDDDMDDLMPLGGRIDSDKVPGDEDYRDLWALNSDVLTILHHEPRWKLFDPTNEYILPIPLEYIDVTRNTTTDLDDASEARVRDVWYDHLDAGRKLSYPWAGQTRFELLHPKPPKASHGKMDDGLRDREPQDLPQSTWIFGSSWTKTNARKKLSGGKRMAQA